ncbi:MAG: methyl-coenzyme M reductase operon protein D, partial [Candidatus Methanomethylophilus sp.]|nr:methyl-coenzyme M reductase operon protein D [Methanomethylophilus sp.]
CGENLPRMINSGPAKGNANNHTERRLINVNGHEVELHCLVGAFYIELAVENEEQLEARVKEIDAAVKPILKDIGYGIDVGRYSKYRPTLHDYK